LRAARFHAYGDFDALHVEEVPVPQPAAGEVLVSVKAAGVNPLDWKLLHGFVSSLFPLELPAGLGIDLAGVVEQLGEGVTELAVGQEVFGQGSSPAYAERATARIASLHVKPPDIAWEVAGSLGVVVGTAYATLMRLAPAPGETLLITGASGGVGLLAAQLAVRRGIEVIGTASPGKQDFVRSLGATPVPYGEGLGERVRALAPDGVDAVLDASGHGELPITVELAGGNERVLTIASSADAAKLDVPYHAGGGGEHTDAALAEALPLIASGQLVFPIAGIYDLGQVGDALRESEHGHPAGKLVVVPE
jgi:NADPH:quinone reductase-like Zn-dependent oxidoreductase